MLDDWLPFPFEPLGSLLVAQGPLWLPWSNMEYLGIRRPFLRKVTAF